MFCWLSTADMKLFLAENSHSIFAEAQNSRGRPGGREPISKNGRNVGFLLWEFGSLPQRSRSGPGGQLVKC